MRERIGPGWSGGEKILSQTLAVGGGGRQGSAAVAISREGLPGLREDGAGAGKVAPAAAAAPVRRGGKAMAGPSRPAADLCTRPGPSSRLPPSGVPHFDFWRIHLSYSEM